MKYLSHLSETDVVIIKETDSSFSCLHNMSPHPVEFRGMTFRNAEELFQWMLFEGQPGVQKKIKDAISPAAAKTIARAHKEVLGRGKRWDTSPDAIPLMKNVLSLKFTQHPELAKKLVEIEPLNTPIILESAKSKLKSKNFWGAYLQKDDYGTEWVGKNMFGILLMELNSFLNFQSMQLNNWVKNDYAIQ